MISELACEELAEVSYTTEQFKLVNLGSMWFKTVSITSNQVQYCTLHIAKVTFTSAEKYFE